jgi:hypothetical protein
VASGACTSVALIAPVVFALAHDALAGVEFEVAGLDGDLVGLEQETGLFGAEPDRAFFAANVELAFGLDDDVAAALSGDLLAAHGELFGADLDVLALDLHLAAFQVHLFLRHGHPLHAALFVDGAGFGLNTALNLVVSWLPEARVWALPSTVILMRRPACTSKAPIWLARARN